MNTLVFTDIKITADSVDVKAQFSYTDKKTTTPDGSAIKPAGMDWLPPTKSNGDFDYMFCLLCVLDVILLCSICLVARPLFKRIKLSLRKPEDVQIADRSAAEREHVVSSGQEGAGLALETIEESVDVGAGGDDTPQAPEESVTQPEEVHVTEHRVGEGEQGVISGQEDPGLAPQAIEEIVDVGASGDGVPKAPEEYEGVLIADQLEKEMEQGLGCDQTDVTDVDLVSQGTEEVVAAGANGDGGPQTREESVEAVMEGETEDSTWPMNTQAQVHCCMCGIPLDVYRTG